MLEVINATMYYKNYIGIESINLKVAPGEIIGIFGENGAGKTTLLKAIMGLVKLNIGYVNVDGEFGHQTYSKLSFITGEGSWFPDLTLAQHGDFYLNMLNDFNKERFFKLLDYFKLEYRKKASSMSKGQCEKLEAAIGFSRGAKYIIMDEPFMGKDIFTRRDFLKLMVGSMTDEEAIVIATHLPAEVSGIISRAIVMKNGRIIKDVLMEELQQEGKSLEEFLKLQYEYDEKRITKFL